MSINGDSTKHKICESSSHARNCERDYPMFAPLPLNYKEISFIGLYIVSNSI